MEKEVTVVDWISDDDATNYECSYTGLGGFFNFQIQPGEKGRKEGGMRWKDYIDTVREDLKQHAEALRKSIVERGLRYTGRDHQYANDGIPLFSDGTTCELSMRAWGDLMAAVWSEEEDKDYNYVDFYC